MMGAVTNMSDNKEKDKKKHGHEKHAEHGHHHHDDDHKSHDHEIKHKPVGVQPDKRYNLIVIGLLIGTMIGAVLTLLLTPRRIWQTSQSLVDTGDDFIASGREKIGSAVSHHHLAKQMRNLIDEVESTIKEAKSAG